MQICAEKSAGNLKMIFMENIYWIIITVIIFLVFLLYSNKKTSTNSKHKSIEKNNGSSTKKQTSTNKINEETLGIITLTQEETNRFINREIYDRTIGSEFLYICNTELDSLFEQAAEVLVIAQEGSTSLLQRNLRIGYNRASRIMEQLEYNKIVGPFESSKAREVYIKNKKELKIVLSKINLKDPKKVFFEENILPDKIDYINEKVEEYYEELHNEELKEQLRLEILAKEEEKRIRKKKEKLKREVIENLSESGLINRDDYITKKREPIPQDVQDKVWNRDGGRCVKCSSNENLEFDHIIPFSKGGSNTYRNLQLLCQKCNREKSNKIG